MNIVALVAQARVLAHLDRAWVVLWLSLVQLSTLLGWQIDILRATLPKEWVILVGNSLPLDHLAIRVAHLAILRVVLILILIIVLILIVTHNDRVHAPLA
jgi:hypothetical protein